MEKKKKPFFAFIYGIISLLLLWAIAPPILNALNFFLNGPIEEIRNIFAVSYLQIGILYFITHLVLLVGLLISSWATTHIAPRKMLLVGVITMAIALALLGLSRQFMLIQIGGILLAIGFAAALPSGLAILFSQSGTGWLFGTLAGLFIAQTQISNRVILTGEYLSFIDLSFREWFFFYAAVIFVGGVVSVLLLRLLQDIWNKYELPVPAEATFHNKNIRKILFLLLAVVLSTWIVQSTKTFFPLFAMDFKGIPEANLELYNSRLEDFYQYLPWAALMMGILVDVLRWLLKKVYNKKTGNLTLLYIAPAIFLLGWVFVYVGNNASGLVTGMGMILFLPALFYPVVLSQLMRSMPRASYGLMAGLFLAAGQLGTAGISLTGLIYEKLGIFLFRLIPLVAVTILALVFLVIRAEKKDNTTALPEAPEIPGD